MKLEKQGGNPVTMRELLQSVVHQCHVFPERIDWPICVRLIEHGGFQEFTVLTAVQPEPALGAFFVNADPQSSL